MEIKLNFISLIKKIYMLLTNAKSNIEKEETLKKPTNNQKESDILPKTTKWIFLILFAGGNIRKYNEPVAGRIRLLKEIFLFKEQAKITEDIYNFKPYKYGPFANEFLRDLNILTIKNYISENEGFGGKIFQLTSTGLPIAERYYNELNDSMKRRLLGIKIRFNMMPLNELLDYVYSMYPNYATYSKQLNDNKFEEA